MTDLLTLTAEVLEKTAAYIDAVESVKVEAEKSARSKTASEVKTRISAAVGEDISDGVAEKLAENTDILSLVSKLAGAQTPAEKLGGASDFKDNEGRIPHNKREAAEFANEKFASWLME